MRSTIKALVIPMLLFSGACHAGAKAGSTKSLAPLGHYTEYTCTFGKYGSVTTHVGGIGRTYIIVNQKRYPSYGGEKFVQSNDDDNVVMMFDRKGNLSYKGDIPGRNCRVSHG